MEKIVHNNVLSNGLVLLHQLVIHQQKEALRYAFDDTVLATRKRCSEALALRPTTEALEAYVKEAVEKEREECANVCDARNDNFSELDDWDFGWSAANHGCASDIRARKDKQ